MRKADKIIANTEANPDNRGLMSIVIQLIAVERNVAPIDSVRVITHQMARGTIRDEGSCKFPPTLECRQRPPLNAHP